MEYAVISGGSKDIQLLVTIAQKMHLNVKFISKEDFAMAKAIKEGETGDLINTSEFLKSVL